MRIFILLVLALPLLGESPSKDAAENKYLKAQLQIAQLQAQFDQNPIVIQARAAALAAKAELDALSKPEEKPKADPPQKR